MYPTDIIHSAWHPNKNYQACKESDHNDQKEKKQKSWIKTKPEATQMIKFVDKYIQIAIMTIFYIFK